MAGAGGARAPGARAGGMPGGARGAAGAARARGRGGGGRGGRGGGASSSWRRERVEKQYAREVADLLCSNEALALAVNPAKLFDGDDSVFAEVTDVSLSGDLQVRPPPSFARPCAPVPIPPRLPGRASSRAEGGRRLSGRFGPSQVAKVFVHVSAGSPGEQERAWQSLQGKAGLIRREMGKRIPLRRTPEVRLIYDDSVEEMERIDARLAYMRLEEEAAAQGISLDDLKAELEAEEGVELELATGDWDGEDEEDADEEGGEDGEDGPYRLTGEEEAALEGFWSVGGLDDEGGADDHDRFVSSRRR